MSPKNKARKVRFQRALAIAAMTTLIHMPDIHGETLDNLMDSKAMQDLMLNRKSASSQGHKNDSHGIDPNTNFSLVWNAQDGGEVLLNWVGAKLPYFSFKKPRSTRSSDLVTAEADLINFDRVSCRISVMIPHPSIAAIVEANVFDEFRQLRPPLLEIISEKSVPLKGGEGTLYEHKRSGASLIIPTAQNGLIRISTVHTKNAQVLVEIAKELDLERLRSKLDS